MGRAEGEYRRFLHDNPMSIPPEDECFAAGYAAGLRRAAELCRERMNDWNEQNIAAASRTAKNRTYQRGTEAREIASAIEAEAKERAS